MAIEKNCFAILLLGMGGVLEGGIKKKGRQMEFSVGRGGGGQEKR